MAEIEFDPETYSSLPVYKPAATRAQAEKALSMLNESAQPLIVAGDFNEWRRHKKNELELHLGMTDAGLSAHGKKLKTFPALMPVWALDRIYLRGFKVHKARILHKGIWGNLSDHAGFSAEVELAGKGVRI